MLLAHFRVACSAKNKSYKLSTATDDATSILKQFLPLKEQVNAGFTVRLGNIEDGGVINDGGGKVAGTRGLQKKQNANKAKFGHVITGAAPVAADTPVHGVKNHSAVNTVIGELPMVSKYPKKKRHLFVFVSRQSRVGLSCSLSGRN